MQKQLEIYQSAKHKLIEFCFNLKWGTSIKTGTLHAFQPVAVREVSNIGKNCIYSATVHCSTSSIWNKLTVYNVDILSVLCIVH
jgi:hypothetical protein